MNEASGGVAKKRCFIFGAAPIKGISLAPKPGTDFVIAADGGLKYLEANGIIPDLIVGDFDSYGALPTGDNIVYHSPIKDNTDTDMAVDEGLKRGFCEYIIYGGLGSRQDHTAANIQTLSRLAKSGCAAYLCDAEFTVTALHNESLSLPAGLSGYISVFSACSQCRGVYLEGLKYPLCDAVLTYDVALGVSNEFTDIAPHITVRDGTLTVMWNDRAFSPDSYIRCPVSGYKQENK